MDEEKIKEGLILELKRIRDQISELEDREIELVRVLGEASSAVHAKMPFIIYAGPEGATVWMPGLFPLSIAPGTANEPEDFSWLKNFVHPEDLPSVERDLNAFASGLQPTVSRRCRIQVLGEMAVWLESYLLATKRDEKNMPVETVAFLRPIGRSGGLGSNLRQVMISVTAFFDSILENGFLESLLESRCEARVDSSDGTVEITWLLLAIVMAEVWRLQKSWELSFVKDRSMKYIWVSDPFARMLGLSCHEMQGRSDYELFQAIDEADEDRMGEAVTGGVTAHCRRTRIVANTSRIFRDSLWPVPEICGGEALWILGVSSLVDERETGVEGHRSPIMLKVMAKVITAAKSDSIILITGESGTGKDHLARDIHNLSRQADGPFFSINCAAISSELAESEFFGHESGSFTGAKSRKRGLLELAEGGTLLLNEIGELSLPLQAKLLSFLDTKKFTRVGGEKEIETNARLIAATNTDLEEAVNRKSFRSDLYYRLNVVKIVVPPLRERLEDLPGIVDEIIRELCGAQGRSKIPRVDPSEMEILRHYDWPGNIREIRNVLERALLFSPEGKLNLREAMPKHFFQADESDRRKPTGGPVLHDWLLSGGFRQDESQGSLLGYAERALIELALKKTNGNQTKAARLLGVTRSAFRSKLNTHGIKDSK